ncbi:MAG: ABC transporter substrate-binding protein [Chloroflexi bacterium]|nr:ABC transporter substrate-binding protein [Chloroflexota bacterium]
MSSRFLSLVGVLSVAAVLLASCAPAAAPPAAKATAAPGATPKPAAEQPRSGGILKTAALADEATFDLHTIGRNLAYEQVSLNYSGLLQYDPADGTKIISDLADKYEMSADGKKVTFTLKPGVKWHDGKTFTSEDVKFNFDRWLKPPEGVAITRREVVAAVEKVETPNPNTVVVSLKYPSASFIPLVAMVTSVMLPPQFLKDRKTMEYNSLGTGPYKLKKYTRGVSVEHEKNADYFIKGRPYLDGVAEFMLPDATARLASFRTGQVRLMFIAIANVTPPQSEQLRTQMGDKVNVARFPALGNTLVYMNTTKPPFNDVKVRQAVDMAIDRKKGMEVAEGRAILNAIMPPGPWALPADELAKRPGYRGVTPDDIARAKALLAEAGFKDGLKVTAVTTSAYAKITVFLQDQLKSIGIDITIETVDQPTLDKRFVSTDFAISIYPPAQPVNDPDLFLNLVVTGGGRNYGKFSDKQIDEWYDQQSKTIDVAKRKEIVNQAQRRALDLAALPVVYGNLLDLPYWKCIKNFYPEKQFGYYNNYKKQDIWLDQGCS